MRARRTLAHVASPLLATTLLGACNSDRIPAPGQDTLPETDESETPTEPIDGCAPFVLDDGLRLENNDDVANASYITQINESLVITEDVTDLTALGCLERVGELAAYHTESLTDLTGLKNLKTVGYISVTGNTALTSLAGLTSLKTVDGGVNITRNPELIDIMMPALEEIGTSFVVGYCSPGQPENPGEPPDPDGPHYNPTGNRKLERLGPFPKLRSLRSVRLAQNDRLSDISDLRGIVDNGGPRLESLDIRQSYPLELSHIEDVWADVGSDHLFTCEITGDISACDCPPGP